LNASLAATAIPIPTSAHTIQAGKYEPKMLRDGGPLHPVDCRAQSTGPKLRGNDFATVRISTWLAP
jgi:hypothetical protein